MAESLRRLVDSQAFTLLQEKTEKWRNNYMLNTCDQNVDRCLELIELNSRVQNQLFSLLNRSAAEGGIYGGSDVLKRRLLPWLSQGYIGSSNSVSADTSLNIIAEAAGKERQLVELQDDYEDKIDLLKTDLNHSQNEADSLKAELEDTKLELASTARQATGEALYSEEEIMLLRRRLQETEDELRLYKSRAGILGEYESEVRRLREDINYLRDEKAILTGRYTPLYAEDPILSSSGRLKSPSVATDIVQRVRQSNLVSRFSDMFAQDRMDAMDILRNHNDVHEINQRIVFACIQEAFYAAKKAFRLYKTKVRQTLAGTHTGPEPLEDVVQSYINKNGQLLDVHSIVQDVLLAMNTHPTLSFPPEVDFKILTLFIRECVKVAWSMGSLPSPIDVATAIDGELFDDMKYRRSYDSEYSAPLINHHVWPALLDMGGKVILKGEAVTRRGAGLVSPRRARSPRSRSPSPRRI